MPPLPPTNAGAAPGVHVRGMKMVAKRHCLGINVQAPEDLRAVRRSKALET